MRMRHFYILTIVILLSMAAERVQSAEIRLRAEASCESTIVRLGDVADILDADPEQSERLRQIELFPTPAPGTQRSLTMRELHDTLHTRDQAVHRHVFSGSTACVVRSARGGNETTSGRIATDAVQRVTENVSKILEEHLRRSVSADVPWIARAKLDPNQALLVQEGGRITAVRGGAAPWYGPQRFEVTLEAIDRSTGQPRRLWVDAEVDAPVAVVVAVRALARGSIVLADDVAVRYVPSSHDSAELFHAVDEVVGMEVEQMVGADRPIERRQVRAPILVRRGEVVTVYSRAAGVSIRTMGRATEDGSRGDVVRIQPLERERQPFYGRVCDRQTVEVFASAMQAAPRASRPELALSAEERPSANESSDPGPQAASGVAPMTLRSSGVGSTARDRSHAYFPVTMPRLTPVSGR